MKNKTTYYLLALMLLILGCQPESSFQLHIQSNLTGVDTLRLTELITNQLIKEIPLKTQDTIVTLELTETKAITGKLSSFNPDNFQLMILSPGEKSSISVTENKISSKSTSDSLFTYINNSNNAAIGQFFSNGNGENEMLRISFDRLILQRQKVLDAKKSELNPEAWKLLTYQNQARAYSFLFYMGRNVWQLHPTDNFFSFTAGFKNQDYAKTLPHNQLYTLEISYLKSSDSIENLSKFVDYIERETPDKDLASFLKIIYLKELLENPSYWLNHQHLFNRVHLEQVVKQEVENPHFYLFTNSIDEYFDELTGQPAANFEAVSINGDTLQLNDLLNKPVVIDVWATWCGACVSQKQMFHSIAKKYSDQVHFISLSIDQNKKKWEAYLTNKLTDKTNEFLIPGGFHFAEDYFIKSIPRYIMINQNGTIIDGDLASPSIAMEQIIEANLPKAYDSK